MEKILAKNLAALMKANPITLGTQPKVAKATKGAINQTTVGRILKAQVSVQMDTLQALAEACGVEPYQLLVPDLDPKNPQVLRTLSAAEERLYKALEEARQQ